ncbi:hypothetical protein [Pseudoblastomonas halimionae]|uniref:Uncharacterized protein n=1 Tax=Alteriqipengyuania halimionae TaxID=1926630 RepID=A0A6I4U367_9SPHN|nr:hypothetical protein [Alteriqipengyuania halimionae]MXP10368.1 hypothetical protein [Alteriqipengyuania halimionae]
MSKTYSENMSRRAVAFVVITLAVALGAKVAMEEWGRSDGGWLAFGLVLLSFSTFMVFGVRFWRSLDDLQRQGHAASWYWGSMAGLALTACLIAATGLRQSEFTLGVATLLVSQLGCYLVLYALWSLKGRGFGFRSGK